MATSTGLMTVEQVLELSESGEFYYELHHGELVKVSRPKFKHSLIQNQSAFLLKQAVSQDYLVFTELAFRALPEYELRVADVAILSKARARQTDPDDILHGAPELVVEVLSPSNTAAEVNDKEKLCLENGSKQFWVVDPKLRQIKVSTPDGITTTFGSGRDIPLAAFGGGVLKVDDMFAAV